MNTRRGVRASRTSPPRCPWRPSVAGLAATLLLGLAALVAPSGCSGEKADKAARADKAAKAVADRGQTAEGAGGTTTAAPALPPVAAVPRDPEAELVGAFGIPPAAGDTWTGTVPAFICLGAAGSLYIGAQDPAGIFRMDAKGNVTARWRPPENLVGMMGPEAAAADALGNLILVAAPQFEHFALTFSPEGKMISRVRCEPGRDAVAPGPDGSVYVASGEAIGRIAKSGKSAGLCTMQGQRWRMVGADPAGNVYALVWQEVREQYTEEIRQIRPDGTPGWKISPGQGDQYVSLTLTPKGNLVAVVQAPGATGGPAAGGPTHAVVRYNAEGRPSGRWALPIDSMHALELRPMGRVGSTIAADDAGTLYTLYHRLTTQVCKYRLPAASRPQPAPAAVPASVAIELAGSFTVPKGETGAPVARGAPLFLCLADNGTIYVGSGAPYGVYKMGLTGELLGRWQPPARRGSHTTAKGICSC